jgi:hypothetical protein
VSWRPAWPAAQLLGAGLQLAQLLVGAVLRHGHQDLGQMDLRRLGGSSGRLALNQMAVDLLIADAHARINLAFTQTDQGDFVAHFAPIALRTHAVGLHAPQQLVDADLVLARHIGHGLIDRSILDAYARIGGHLHLRALDDQALQDLAGQLRRGLLSTSLGQHTPDAVAHILVGDRFGVDDGHDEIERPDR